MTDQPVTLRFGKVDNLTGELIAGAEFNVYNDAEWQANAATAAPVYTFTSKTTPVEVKGLFTAGTLYRLVETKAPAGYQLNGGTMQFRAPSDDTVVTIEMKKPAHLPVRQGQHRDRRGGSGRYAHRDRPCGQCDHLPVDEHRQPVRVCQ